MQEMSRSETTKQVKQPSPYRLIRYHLRNLHSDIEGEEWRQASQDLQRLEQAVSMEIGRTGQEPTDKPSGYEVKVNQRTGLPFLKKK